MISNIIFGIGNASKNQEIKLNKNKRVDSM